MLGYLLPPLPTFPDSVKQTPSTSFLINQDSVKQTQRIAADQSRLHRTDAQPVRPAKELLSAADKTLTTKKTASTRCAPIILDKEVKAMREQAIPKNTRKLTNWATTVWIDWTEYRRSTALLLDLVIHLMNN